MQHPTDRPAENARIAPKDPIGPKDLIDPKDLKGLIGPDSLKDPIDLIGPNAQIALNSLSDQSDQSGLSNQG